MNGPKVARQGRVSFWVPFLLCTALLVPSCSEDRNPVGFDRSGREVTTAVLETTLVSVSHSVYHASPTTGTARSILVGSDDRSNSIGLIRFDAIPDTAGLLRASLRVHFRRGRGGPLDLRLARNKGGKEAWSPTDVKWNTRPEADAVPLSTARGNLSDTLTTTTDSVDFAVPPSLLGSWRAEPDSNGGFQIARDGGTGTARIVSHNDPIFGKTYRIATPSLHLVYRDAEREETIVLASADAYVFEDLRPIPSATDSVAWVTAGPPARLRMSFDLAHFISLHPHASISRATLQLHHRGIDTLFTPFSLGAYEVTSASDTSSALASTATGLSNKLAKRPFELELGPLVQRWLDGTSNLGVVVRSIDEVSTLEGVEFYTENAATDALRPRLRIVFVPPAEPRWPEKP